jgi:hypothetical protein
MINECHMARLIPTKFVPPATPATGLLGRHPCCVPPGHDAYPERYLVLALADTKQSMFPWLLTLKTAKSRPFTVGQWHT